MRLSAITLSLLAILLLVSVPAFAEAFLFTGDAYNYGHIQWSSPGFYRASGDFTGESFTQCGGPCPGPTFAFNPVNGFMWDLNGHNWDGANHLETVDLATGQVTGGMTGNVQSASLDGSSYFSVLFWFPFNGWLVQSGHTIPGNFDFSGSTFQGTIYLDDFITQLEAAVVGTNTTVTVNFSETNRSLFLDLQESDIPATVPEPSLPLLLCIGLVGVVGLGWRYGRG